MIEISEAQCLAEELKKNVVGRTVKKVNPPTKEHKFCSFNADPQNYNEIINSKITGAKGFGIFVELSFDNGMQLCFCDGINLRITDEDKIPENYQLSIIFDNSKALVCTVSLYGGIFLHDDTFDNNYYLTSKNSISPFSSDFKEHFYKILSESKPNLSAKAFLATEQRFPGIGNGTLQDILFNAKIHPKRKISTINDDEREVLFNSIINTLDEMIKLGGRNTEKDIFGNIGRYTTNMSKNSVGTNCPICGEKIVKEAYLGGSVYYCPNCQPLK